MSRLTAAEREVIDAAVEYRRRMEREALSSRYDFYGDECGCALAEGDCPEHPGGCECPAGLGECREHHRGRADQRPPGTYRSSLDRGDWKCWLVEGGRGSGKTRPMAEWITHEAEANPGIWIGLVSETVKDVRDVMIEHPSSGLLAVSPPWFKAVYFPSLARVDWPNGSFATIYSAEAPDALRGPEFGRVWMDEFAKWSLGQREVYDNVQMCLRRRAGRGEISPRMGVSTTPRPGPVYKELREDELTVRTGAPTLANRANLDPVSIQQLYKKYAGTRLGDQELEAILREDIPGALWTSDLIDRNRLSTVPEGVHMVRLVVSVDPGVGAQNPESAAEAGITVVGRGSDGHGYLLADCSTKGSPRHWIGAAIGAYRAWGADRVVAEINNGGELVEMVLRGQDPNLPYSTVWASRGKQTRAEPVSALYEQNRFHHIGRFAQLEQQMCSFVPGEKSPDRMDALVWGATETMLGEGSGGAARAGGTRTPLLNHAGRRSLGKARPSSRPAKTRHRWGGMY